MPTILDIDVCADLEFCRFYDLQYPCVNVLGGYYCDPVSDHKSSNKIIIIGMSFILPFLRSIIIEKRFT